MLRNLNGNWNPKIHFYKLPQTWIHNNKIAQTFSFCSVPEKATIKKWLLCYLKNDERDHILPSSLTINFRYKNIIIIEYILWILSIVFYSNRETIYYGYTMSEYLYRSKRSSYTLFMLFKMKTVRRNWFDLMFMIMLFEDQFFLLMIKYYLDNHDL